MLFLLCLDVLDIIVTFKQRKEWLPLKSVPACNHHHLDLFSRLRGQRFDPYVFVVNDAFRVVSLQGKSPAGYFASREIRMAEVFGLGPIDHRPAIDLDYNSLVLHDYVLGEPLVVLGRRLVYIAHSV